MSCGVCPGDLIGRGFAISNRVNFYSGPPTYGGGCGKTSQQFNHYLKNISSQGNANYGGERKMKYVAQIPSIARYGFASNIVENKYARPLYTPLFKLDLGEKLEARVDSGPISPLEAKLEPEYRTVRDLLEVEDSILDNARSKVRSLEERRREVENSIRELRKEAA